MVASGEKTKANERPLEDEILSVLRVFILVELVLFSLGLCASLLEPGGSPPYFTIFLILHAAVLLLLLSWRELRRVLGRVHLPLTLLLASLGPGLAYAAASGLNLLGGLRGEEALIDPGALVLWQLAPLLLVSSQYGLATMLAFCMGVTSLDVAAAAGMHWLGGPPVGGMLTEAAIRLVLFLMIGYVVVRISRAHRQQRAELLEANSRLGDYASNLEQLTTSRERNRMARELHDTLAHTLSGVSVQLEAVRSLWDADPLESRRVLERALAATRQGLTETRRALNDLRASPLDDLGLALAIRNLAEAEASRAGFTLVLEIPEQLDDLSPALRQCVYRTVQEALANIDRHASASQVQITIRRAKDRLALAVCDDGQGFDPASVDTGHSFGIRGMCERAELLGGRLEVESSPGAGACIRLEVEER